jgi:hypothetical protein
MFGIWFVFLEVEKIKQTDLSSFKKLYLQLYAFLKGIILLILLLMSNLCKPVFAHYILPSNSMNIQTIILRK